MRLGQVRIAGCRLARTSFDGVTALAEGNSPSDLSVETQQSAKWDGLDKASPLQQIPCLGALRHRQGIFVAFFEEAGMLCMLCCAQDRRFYRNRGVRSLSLEILGVISRRIVLRS